MERYLDKLLFLCQQDKIPAMREQTIRFLYRFLDYKSELKICEIGTAYGYSSLYLSRHKNVQQIITIERDEKRYEVARQWLADQPKITICHTCAFAYRPEQQFDLIILDGPKSKQDILFEKYCPYLVCSGYFFIDNLNLFDNSQELTKNQTKLKTKVRNFKNWLINLDPGLWQKEFYEIDDGFCLIKKLN